MRENENISSLNKLGDELVDWMKSDKDNVWLKEFATLKGFPAGNISRYSKQSKYFAEKLAIAKDMQESKLVKGVLDKHYSPTFVKFILKNEAGWKDKIEETRKDEVPAINLILAETNIENIKPAKVKKPGKRKKKDNKDQIAIFNEEQ